VNERQLIARILKGDARAERSLYDAHVDRVYRLAYRMTGDETMAEDLTQETFLRTFSKLSNFEGRSSLGTWIHSITVSVVLSALRKVKRFRRRETELTEPASSMARTESPDPVLKLSLHRAIDALSDDLRLVVVMHDIEGYRYEEMADMIGIPAGTVKSRLFRAREALRESLSDGNRFPSEEDGS
jgi:RNA polymerase sigma-70 factor (ECF subfamily)